AWSCRPRHSVRSRSSPSSPWSTSSSAGRWRWPSAPGSAALPSSSRLKAAQGVRKALAYDAERSLPRLVEMTQALVRVASPNPRAAPAAVADVAEALLAMIPGVEIRRVEPEPGIVNLVARVRAKNPGRRLIFNGHLDTFPIGGEVGWTAPPLSGALREG